MKKILGSSDAWSMKRLFHQPSEPAYYILDWRISTERSRKVFTNSCTYSRQACAEKDPFLYWFPEQKQILYAGGGGDGGGFRATASIRVVSFTA